eukprot:TRINITY_DN77808_c0_g1_i1.p1 TRINITY_DN77808_c0_g1~~TRINITY_DN77808_c0_g1_i1.p1  ORF type:complete len:419 (-),score=105.61 TRINITY_DN77808_c0_g1_i1:112-1197(-)
MDLELRSLCHKGVRNEHGRICNYYKSPVQDDPSFYDQFPALSKECTSVTWKTANESYFAKKTGKWGNCVNMTEDSKFRYITSNQVPDYYFNPYCPFGVNFGYCIPNEPCPFPTLKCGVSESGGFTPYGDVWVAALSHYKIPLEGNPTLDDRPADMYQTAQGGFKDQGPATGVHLNGVSIQGPNDAGDVNVDEAGFQLMCGGHVTPPVDVGPIYHYHKAADCSDAFLKASIPASHGGDPTKHGILFGYALDGFGIYSYEDIGGAAPVLDECGGHFGPVDDDSNSSEVVYHYHATTYTPYHLACQGPALGKCHEVQHGADFCGKGCGADLCVQPGTEKSALERYIARFDASGTYLSKHSINKF